MQGFGVVDLRIVDDRVAEIGRGLVRRPGELEVNAAGGAVLPGLHDHHVHLLAMSAAVRSISCGPPDVTNTGDLIRALRAASASGGWIRGVGYHEDVAGALDRSALDAWVPERPLRIQHRSGALWMLNSAALRSIGADALRDSPVGLERDVDGRLTGRLWRLDEWLRDRVDEETPDLSEVGCRLVQAGVTGVTDATPSTPLGSLRLLVEACARGDLPQRVVVLGSHAADLRAAGDANGRVTLGPRKLVLDDRELPSLAELCEWIDNARGSGAVGVRPVAVHSVTEVSLLLLLAALDETGCVPGDRVEHASVVPAGQIGRLRSLGLRVVTQPGFIAARGDAYARDIPDRTDDLYRYASLIAGGLQVGLSTDAPYTEPDPWGAIRSAVKRETATGRVLGAGERVSQQIALEGFMSDGHDPGGPPRQVSVGALADLCVLDRPIGALRIDRERPEVTLTLIGGVVA